MKSNQIMTISYLKKHEIEPNYIYLLYLKIQNIMMQIMSV